MLHITIHIFFFVFSFAASLIASGEAHKTAAVRLNNKKQQQQSFLHKETTEYKQNN